MSKELPNRRTVRLRGYDYSQSGLYFITICAYHGEHIFGEIRNNEMILNTVGQIARDCWLETERIRPNIILGEFVVMPNHFHAVFAIDNSVRANRRGVLHTPVDSDIVSGLFISGVCNTPLRSPSQTVGAVVRGYKSMVSKRIGFPVWQRNYHEHIIRNQTAYDRIIQYIIDNPARWQDDCFS